jgi:uncharacterized protein
VQAVERFGIVRGGWMATWRVLRCNPFSKGGVDPVEKRAGQVFRPADQNLSKNLGFSRRG